MDFGGFKLFITVAFTSDGIHFSKKNVTYIISEKTVNTRLYTYC